MYNIYHTYALFPCDIYILILSVGSDTTVGGLVAQNGASCRSISRIFSYIYIWYVFLFNNLYKYMLSALVDIIVEQRKKSRTFLENIQNFDR